MIVKKDFHYTYFQNKQTVDNKSLSLRASHGESKNIILKQKFSLLCFFFFATKVFSRAIRDDYYLQKRDFSLKVKSIKKTHNVFSTNKELKGDWGGEFYKEKITFCS